MTSRRVIQIALFPIVLLSPALLGQNTARTLPNAPEASTSLVTSAQPPSSSAPPASVPGTDTPVLLTRQQAEKLWFANVAPTNCQI
jgi:hypothetical protein